MRVIKFRAWDNEHKKFNLTVAANILMQLHEPSEEIDAEYGKRFFLGQFTGLTDKNGKDIYEGDVLERTTLLSDGGIDIHKGVVTYEDAIYYSKSINNEISRSLGGKSINTTYEVIGNIHENSDLL